MAVPAAVSLVTLGVDDVTRATAFYETLGWERSTASTDEVSFFRTAGAILALWRRSDLAEDANVAASGGEAGSVSLAINVGGDALVDEALATAERAGATILKPAQPTPWGGYQGYFRDFDGHVWEVAHNPGWPLGPDGLPRLP